MCISPCFSFFFSISMKKFIVVCITIALCMGITPSTSFAAEIPNLTTCVAPVGTLKTNHTSGIHGIPGDSNTYSGSDSVYTVSENYSAQCFCPENGQGIQTDWVKADGFSQEEIKIYTNQGWIYIPNGSAWGLSDAPYLAKNSSYSCKSSGGGGSSSSSSSSVGGASSTNNSTGGSVLGLATTGNSLFVLSVFAAGIASTLTGLALRKRV